MAVAFRYLPELVNKKRLLVPREEEANTFSLDNSALQSEARGFSYRRSPETEDRDSIFVTYGSVLRGELSKGWLKVNLAEQGAEFSIQLEREEGKKYGVVFNTYETGVKVKSLAETGLIASWNRDHADWPIEAGYFLVEVNGERGEDMMDELDESGFIEMTFRKGLQSSPKREMPKISMSMMVPGLAFQALNWAGIDLAELGYRRHVEAAFLVVAVGCLLLLGVMYTKIQSVPAEGLVKVAAAKTFGVETSPATELSPRAYDMSQWKESLKEALCGPVISGLVYYKWEAVSMLVLQVLMAVLKVYESPLFSVHVLGKQMPRPYDGSPKAAKSATSEAKKKD